MNTDVAIAICEEWFAYTERQRQKSVELQRLASLARTGLEGQKEAQLLLRQLRTSSIAVYDGGRLEPAVQELVKLARSQLSEPCE